LSRRLGVSNPAGRSSFAAIFFICGAEFFTRYRVSSLSFVVDLWSPDSSRPCLGFFQSASFYNPPRCDVRHRAFDFFRLCWDLDVSASFSMES